MRHPKVIANLPMPVGPKTVAPSVEDPEPDPGKNGQDHKCKMDRTRSLEGPANQDERNDQNVSDMKKNVKELKESHCRL